VKLFLSLFQTGERQPGSDCGPRRSCSRTAPLQPAGGYPNAGSFFKNPDGKSAWRLIDEAGLRGCRIGGAQVSEVHANFLVNRAGATAVDFIALAEQIRNGVLKTTGILLEEEVKIVGED
jgi:UDP-N-acetylmuramate dehydrogenase